MSTVEPIIHSRTRRWKYTRYAGHAGSRFLIELRDNKRIMGTKFPDIIEFTCPQYPFVMPVLNQ